MDLVNKKGGDARMPAIKKLNHRQGKLSCTFTALIPLFGNREFYDFAQIHGEIRGSAKRFAFRQINSAAGIPPENLDEEICRRYGVDLTEAKYIIKEALSVHESQIELLELRITEETERIKTLEEKVDNTIKKLSKRRKRDSKTRRDNRVYNQLQSTRRKLDQKRANLVNLLNQKKQNRVSVSFGTKDLQRKQHNLKENHFIHDGWLSDWRRSRSGNLFYEGSRNYASGNQKARLIEQEDGSFSLEVALPSYLCKEKVNKVVASNVKFSRGKSEILAAMQPELIGTAKRNGTRLPVTNRIVFHENGYLYLHTTVDVDCPEILTHRSSGAIGIDLNARSVEWTLVDGKGNYKLSQKIPANVHDVSSEKTEDVLGKLCQTLVKIAHKHKTPIVIEDLDFSKKKSRTSKDSQQSKAYRRMLSGFPYSKFKELLERACQLAGVELIIVDPAFTSLIGIIKYMSVYGLSSGTAAGMVIARRGLGFKEKFNKSCRLACLERGIEVGTTSGMWASLSKKVGKKGGLVGASRRHEFFSGHWKLTASTRETNLRSRKSSDSFVQSPRRKAGTAK